MNSKIFAYGRISSSSQNENRQTAAFAELGIDERNIFIDKVSGKNFDRPNYQALKLCLRENDLLIIKSIDRLGRDYKMIIDEWRDIVLNIGADVRVIDMPMLDTTKHKDLLGNFISDLILQVLSYVAEQERSFIKQRQREGIDLAKIKGTKTGNNFGRPKIAKPINFNEVVARWQNKEITAVKAMKELSLNKSTFYSMIKKI